MAAHGCRDGVLVAGNAADQHGAPDALCVQFLDPPCRERFRRLWRLPSEFPAQIGHALRSPALGGQSGEEAIREEMTVCVVDHAAILLALRAHAIVSAIATTMRPDDSPIQSPITPHP